MTEYDQLMYTESAVAYRTVSDKKKTGQYDMKIRLCSMISIEEPLERKRS